MKELVEGIEKQISTDKDVISVLPRNGIKAIKTLLETINEMIAKYEKLNEKLLGDIEERYNKLTSVEANPKISELEAEIERYVSAEKILDNRTPFEKMGLDKICYNVNGYYKSDLQRLNSELVECVKKFEAVGINITAEDFDMSEYSKEYMEVLLEEAYNGNINSEKIKDAFEKVYCKCSEVVSHLYVNIRHIYDIHEEHIRKFYANKSEEILKNLKSTSEGIEEKRAELIKHKKDIEETDNKIILNKFYTGALNINDYKQDNYKKLYLELTAKDVTQLEENEKSEIDYNIDKLNSNLIEYSKYSEYRFLVDEILQIRTEELKNIEENKSKKVKKTEYDLVKDNIKKTTSEIFKINGKINNKKGFLGIKVSKSKKNGEMILQRNNLILEVKKAYMQLDDEIIKQNIIKNIDEISSLLDVLKLASNYYGFLAKSIIKKNEEITDKEIGENIKKIRDFINFSNFTVINYIKISDTKDLATIIKDKYKLFGMQVSKENFQEDSIDDLIRKVKIINTYNNIQKSKFSIEDLEYITTVKEMLKKNNYLR